MAGPFFYSLLFPPPRHLWTNYLDTLNVYHFIGTRGFLNSFGQTIYQGRGIT
jgi:hypothetical protein